MKQAALAIVVVLYAACSDGGDADVARGGPIDTSATQAERGRVTPNAVVDSALQRLRAGGLVPRLRGEVSQPFLAVPGSAIELARGELQLYVYQDSAAAARDVRPLDPERVAPPTMMITWTAPPLLVVRRNLVAIVLTRDEELRERVSNALVSR